MTADLNTPDRLADARIFCDMASLALSEHTPAATAEAIRHLNSALTLLDAPVAGAASVRVAAGEAS